MTALIHALMLLHPLHIPWPHCPPMASLPWSRSFQVGQQIGPRSCYPLIPDPVRVIPL